MTYIPIKNQYINAYKFTGEITTEMHELGIHNIPRAVTISCSCGNPIKDHALVGERIICPNSYIIYEGDQIVNIMNASTFENLYKPAYDLSKIEDAEYTSCEDDIEVENANEV